MSENEIAFVLSNSNGSVYAVEFKINETKGVGKGFGRVCEQISPTHQMVVHSGEADHPPASTGQRLSLIGAI